MDDKPTAAAEHSTKAPQAKQPYKAPTLQPLGTLTDVTLSVGARGSSDGGRKGPRNTSL
jgi:hypothetical protein